MPLDWISVFQLHATISGYDGFRGPSLGGRNLGVGSPYPALLEMQADWPGRKVVALGLANDWGAR